MIPGSPLMEVTVDVSYTKISSSTKQNSHITATWASNVTSDVQSFDEQVVNGRYDHSTWTVYGESSNVLLNGHPNYPQYAESEVLLRTATIFPVINDLQIIAVGLTGLPVHYPGVEPLWPNAAPHY
jgi:hypothetical protein